MARGGYRPGAGRPKGAKTAPAKKAATKKAAPQKRAPKAVPKDVLDGAAAEGLTPLEYMLKVMRDDAAEKNDRMRMAVAAAPFVHPRAGEVKPGKKDLQQEAASKAAKSKFAPMTAPLKLVRP
jgi:hypothetical protein